MSGEGGGGEIEKNDFFSVNLGYGQDVGKDFYTCNVVNTLNRLAVSLWMKFASINDLWIMVTNVHTRLVCFGKVWIK